MEGRCEFRGTLGQRLGPLTHLSLSLVQLQHQGSPFSDPDFSMPEPPLRTLPPTAMPLRSGMAWKM